MKTDYIQNIRELRSLKLLKQTIKTKKFFENSYSNGLFLSCDALHPKDRISLNEALTKQNLKIETLPKNIIKFLFKKKEFNDIKNLLYGNIILIKTLNNIELDINQINFLLKQDKMYLRFLYWNNIVYRINNIENFIKDTNSNYKINTVRNLAFPINLFNSVLLMKKH